MRTLADFLRITPGLEAEDAEWLHLLVEDWHLLADLSFSDLVLWVEHEGGWVAAAHTRPMTGPMVFVEEVVGQPASNVFGDLVDRAAQEGQSEHVRERGQDLIHERARTVRRAGRRPASKRPTRRWATISSSWSRRAPGPMRPPRAAHGAGPLGSVTG